MAYQPQDPNNRQAAIQQSLFNAQHGTLYPLQQPPRPTANGCGLYNANTYQANDLVAPLDGAIQHRQPIPQLQKQQRAFAVAIPAPSALDLPLAVNDSDRYSGILNMQPPPYKTPPLDYQLLLLSLAEEYFAAAYGYGSMANVARRESEMESYYKMMATGLGCLEAVLKHFKMQPEREAMVRLRYATLLFEETENTMEAEEALNKGIVICERHRFFDLKYNMQHLLARMLFSKTPRAAFKFLDGILKDTEAYQHIAWVYAFRFLKVSMHLELSSHQDLIAAVNLFKSITSMSSGYGDKAILAIGTTLEALTCLRISSNAEYIEEAQRALAGVRSLQLDPATGELHQLTSHNGIIRRRNNDFIDLMFNWMPKEDIYNVGYLLGGASMANRNTVDGQKSEHMLEEGIKRLEWAQRENSKVPKSITVASSQQIWREHMTCYMRLYLAFTLCARTSWSAAREQQAKIEASVGSMVNTPDALLLLTVYLKAVIFQGTGNLTNALLLYQSSILSLPAPPDHRSRSQISLDISILSTLNTILIIRSPYHPQNHLVPSLVSNLELLCLQNKNHQISSAYHLVAATTSSDTILLTKQSLQSALQASKQTDNKHLMCMVLNFMSWKFFRGAVGEQAERSARASQNLAQQCMNGLWMSVSAGLLGDTLEVAGRNEEAERARQSGIKTSGSLPQALQIAMNGGLDGQDVPITEGGQKYDVVMRVSG
ncbi:MAG: hypothetical protein ASARMPRED_008730 [Alectoria sarmentosa]|nr:MAG: hypothetical protein ASARMPRED_008730 [Alectoria sarmentosa]